MQKSTKYYFESSSLLGWGSDSGPDRERIALLTKYVTGEKILDVGCGPGIYVDFLSSVGYECVGVDFVEEFIKAARQTKKGTFVQASATKLPFKDGEFNTVILFNVLEHEDDIRVLKEAKRVSKSDILVIVPKKVNFELEQTGVIFRHYMDKSHLREYEEKDLNEIAQKAGLQLVNVLNIHPLNNESIFLALLGGPKILGKILRKLVFFLLPKKNYPTEYFAVFKI